MGDRANIFVVQHPYGEPPRADGKLEGIYLYTHWSGYQYPEILRKALLAAKGRWGDEQYLTRILISQVFKHDHDSETGAGVSTYMCDNSYAIICVDDARKVVGFAEPGDERDLEKWTFEFPFADYVALDEAKWPGDTEGD